MLSIITFVLSSLFWAILSLSFFNFLGCCSGFPETNLQRFSRVPWVVNNSTRTRRGGNVATAALAATVSQYQISCLNATPRSWNFYLRWKIIFHDRFPPACAHVPDCDYRSYSRYRSRNSNRTTKQKEVSAADIETAPWACRSWSISWDCSMVKIWHRALTQIVYKKKKEEQSGERRRQKKKRWTKYSIFKV